MKIRYILSLIMLSYSGLSLFAYQQGQPWLQGQPTQDEIRRGAQNLTQDVKTKMKLLIEKEKTKAAGNLARTNQLEAALNYFRSSQYGLMIAELNRLKINLKEKLGMTILRQELLTRELREGMVPDWVNEIVAIDYLFEQNFQKPASQQRWKTPQDKANYLMRLAEKVEKNYLLISNEKLYVLNDAVAILEAKLIEIKNLVSVAIQSKISEKLIQLVKVLESSRLTVEPTKAIGPPLSDKPTDITVEPTKAIGPPLSDRPTDITAEPTKVIGPPASKIVPPEADQIGSGSQGIRYDPDAPTHTPDGHVIYY